MKKLIILLLSVLIIVIGGFIIKKLLDPNIEYALERKEDIGDKNLYNYGKYFETYAILDSTDFSYEKDDLKIYYKDGNLSINDYTISEVDAVYKFFSIYNKEMVVIGYTSSETNYLIFLNFIQNKELKIREYKDFQIDFLSGITFDDDGVTVNFTKFKDNKLKYNNKDICKIKDEEMVVSKTIIYPYNSENHWIEKAQELYSFNLFSYKSKNNLCR